jgi:hypothetical protein
VCPACGKGAAEGGRVRLEFVIDGVVTGPPRREECAAYRGAVVYRVVVE